MATAKPLNRTANSRSYRIELPPPQPPSAKELQQRRQLEAEVMRLRHEIGPLGMRVDQLIREARGEDDA